MNEKKKILKIYNLFSPTRFLNLITNRTYYISFDVEFYALQAGINDHPQITTFTYDTIIDLIPLTLCHRTTYFYSIP